jgi:hypothetical protein
MMNKLTLISLLVLVAARHAGADFSYTTPTGMRWTVIADGLSAIHLYTELVWDAQQKQYGFAFLPLEHIEFFRWLCPDVPICARLHFEKFFEAPAPDAPTPFEFLMQHRLTPLFADYQLVRHPEECTRVGETIRRLMDDAGQWRENP